VNKDIGNRIKKIRLIKNIDPKHLADEIGVRHTSLSKIEREGTNSVETLLKIAEALEVKPSELFEDKQKNTAKEPKPDYGYATKDELSEITHALLKLTRAVEKLQEERLPKKKAAPKKKYGKK
jgi:transcriptional regulator with XRE-family HTH domain